MQVSKWFDLGKKLSLEKQIERYENLISILKETVSTSMIHDVEGDEEFIDNKIFKKKK